MSDLRRIIAVFNDHSALRAIFGDPVSRSLVVVADNGDLRIEEGGRTSLTEADQRTFLEVLQQTLHNVRDGESSAEGQDIPSAGETSRDAERGAAHSSSDMDYDDYGNLSLEHEYHNLANDYYKIGEFQKAIEHFDKALELRPDLLESYFNRSLAYTRLSEYDRAIEDLNQVIELNPQLAEAYYTRGLVHEYKLEYDLAVLDYNTALESDPSYSKAESQRRIALGKKAKRAGLPNPDRLSVTEALALSEPIWLGDEAGQRRFVAEQLATARLRAGKPQEALSCAAEALDQPSDADVVQQVLGEASISLAKTAAADADQTEPDDAEGRIRLLKQAAAWFGQADQTPVDMAPHLADFGSVLLNIGRNRKALEVFQRCLELEPDDIFVIEKMAECLTMLRRWRETVALRNDAIRIAEEKGKQHDWIHHNQSVTLSYLGRYGEALAALEEAQLDGMEDAYTHVTQSCVARHLGRFDDAARHMAQAAEDREDGSAPFVWLNAALTLADLGEEEEAFRILEDIGLRGEAVLTDLETQETVAETQLRIARGWGAWTGNKVRGRLAVSETNGPGRRISVTSPGDLPRENARD